MRKHLSVWAAVTAAVIALPAFVAAQAQDSTPKPKPATPGFDFSGWVFGSFGLETDSAAKANNAGSSPNKFDIGRAYLNFKMPAGDRASVRVTTDIKQGQSATGAYQGWFVRLKYAYVQYDYVKPTSNGFSAWARVGMLTTILIDHEEQFWPRWVINTSTDRLGGAFFFSSADVGAATDLTLPNKWGEIYATITNGSGYENPEADRFKDYALRVSLTPFGQSKGYWQTFTISPWLYYGQNPSSFVHDPENPISDGLKKNRYGVFLGIRDRRAQLGAEWAQTENGSDAGSEDALDRVITNTTGTLYDGFAVLRPLEWAPDHGKVPSIGILARYDHFKPNKDAAGYQVFYVGGLFWDPTPKTSFSIDYQKTDPKDGYPGNPQSFWFVHWQVAF